MMPAGGGAVTVVGDGLMEARFGDGAGLDLTLVRLLNATVSAAGLPAAEAGESPDP